MKRWRGGQDSECMCVGKGEIMWLYERECMYVCMFAGVQVGVSGCVCVGRLKIQTKHTKKKTNTRPHTHTHTHTTHTHTTHTTHTTHVPWACGGNAAIKEVNQLCHFTTHHHNKKKKEKEMRKMRKWQ